MYWDALSVALQDKAWHIAPYTHVASAVLLLLADYAQYVSLLYHKLIKHVERILAECKSIWYLYKASCKSM